MSTDNTPPVVPNVDQANEVDVQDLHASIVREHNEPHDGFEPVPFWMLLFFGLLLGWGGWYVGLYSADFNPNALDRPEPKAAITKSEEIPKDEAGLARLGEKKYNAICVTCHLPTGEGNTKEYPPLNKSEWVAGTKASPARLARILLYGLAGEVQVRGQSYGTAVMPAQGGSLKDHEIAAVLTYIRGTWDNKAPAIWPEDVAAARKKIGSRGSMTTKELDEVLDFSDPGAKSKGSGAPGAKQ